MHAAPATTAASPHAPAADATAPLPTAALPRGTAWMFPLLGLLQGLGLWLLSSSRDGWLRSQLEAPLPTTWTAAAYSLVAALPLAWFLGDERPGAARRRWAVAGLLGLLCAALGWHAGATTPSAHFYAAIGLLPAVALLGFVLLTLASAWRLPPAGPRLDYARLFTCAWRSALALPLAALLAGIFFLLLRAAAWLMASIGLDGMARLIDAPAFHLPVGGAVLGLALGAVLQRAELLRSVRHFWLTMNTWFLPLALGFALLWLLGLAFTGVKPLFATRLAAQYLFWFCLLCIVFTNAAFQDGREPPQLPPLVAQACRRAWLALPVLVLLGDWALWQRVAQYGWTSDRIWAAVVGTVLTLHCLGYAASSFAPARARGWMQSLPATNIAVSFVMVLLLLALLTPLADSRRLAVESQVDRLLDGRLDAASFDWNLLAEPNVYARRALDRLAALPPDTPARQAIARRAAEQRRRAASLDASVGPAATLAQRREALARVPVLPAGQALPGELLDWLADGGRRSPMWACTGGPGECLFWLTDLDRDGQPELMAVSGEGNFAVATLYARLQGQWKALDITPRPELTVPAWRDAIEQGHVLPVAPVWPDLKVNGGRLRIDDR